jgi:hypothetical protein
LDSMIESEDASDALAVAICHATHAIRLVGRASTPAAGLQTRPLKLISK